MVEIEVGTEVIACCDFDGSMTSTGATDHVPAFTRGVVYKVDECGDVYHAIFDNCLNADFYYTFGGGIVQPDEAKPVIRRTWSTTPEDIKRKGVY
jgi:hypothetical protein